MKAGWTKRTLNFKQPAGTSRGVMKTRDLWYITISENGKTGIGECAPLPGLSLDNIDEIELKLGEVCRPKQWKTIPSCNRPGRMTPGFSS